MKICFFLLLISICFKIDAQQIDFKVLENIENCSECKGICLKYDTDGILAAQIFYSQHATVDSIYYFNLKGERILRFRPDYKIDSSCFESIQAAGVIIGSFFVNSNLEVLDVRILSGINQDTDQEVKRAIRIIDKSILSCAVNGAELQQVRVFIKL